MVSPSGRPASRPGAERHTSLSRLSDAYRPRPHTRHVNRLKPQRPRRRSGKQRDDPTGRINDQRIGGHRLGILTRPPSTPPTTSPSAGWHCPAHPNTSCGSETAIRSSGCRARRPHEPDRTARLRRSHSTGRSEPARWKPPFLGCFSRSESRPSSLRSSALEFSQSSCTILVSSFKMSSVFT